MTNKPSYDLTNQDRIEIYQNLIKKIEKDIQLIKETDWSNHKKLNEIERVKAKKKIWDQKIKEIKKERK